MGQELQLGQVYSGWKLQDYLLWVLAVSLAQPAFAVDAWVQKLRDGLLRVFRGAVNNAEAILHLSLVNI